MEANAYTLGRLDASLQYGLTKEAYARAIVPTLGALAGYALAPEGEKGRGALLGGLGGLGMQSLVLGASAPRTVQLPKPASHSPIDMAKLTGYGRALLSQGREDIGKWLKEPYVAQKTATVDIGGTVALPGFGGVGLGLKDQRERLPGMSRWVPRATVERGFDYIDAGLSPEEAMETEASRGELLHPAAGAALAAGAAYKYAPKKGLSGLLLAGLGGAGAGELYHLLTRDTRKEHAAEAYEGARREREKFPLARHPTQTANEASPLTISRGYGE